VPFFTPNWSPPSLPLLSFPSLQLVGSGVLQGLDGRNETANDAKVGGILQLADYVSGLSGGSWATGSLAMNDWRTTQDLKDNVWDLESNLIIPEDDKVSTYADWVSMSENLFCFFRLSINLRQDQLSKCSKSFKIIRWAKPDPVTPSLLPLSLLGSRCCKEESQRLPNWSYRLLGSFIIL